MIHSLICSRQNNAESSLVGKFYIAPIRAMRKYPTAEFAVNPQKNALISRSAEFESGAGNTADTFNLFARFASI